MQVRKCAQDCLLTVFKLFGSSTVFKKASKLFYTLLKNHLPLALEMSTSEVVDRSKSIVGSRPEHQEVLRLLNVLKHVIPSISPKFRSKTLGQLLKILTSRFSSVTKHILEVISVIVQTSESEFIVSNAEDIFKSLTSYISLLENNPVDTVLFGSTIAKEALGKISGCNTEWPKYFPLVAESLAGMLSVIYKSAISFQKLCMPVTVILASSFLNLLAFYIPFSDAQHFECS